MQLLAHASSCTAWSHPRAPPLGRSAPRPSLTRAASPVVTVQKVHMATAVARACAGSNAWPPATSPRFVLRCNALCSTSAPLAAPLVARPCLRAATAVAWRATTRRRGAPRAVAAAASGNAFFPVGAEGSGAEEAWSPVASQDPLFDLDEEFVHAEMAPQGHAPGGQGRNIMVRVAVGQAGAHAVTCMC